VRVKDDDDDPPGLVGLSDALIRLRRDLLTARDEGAGQGLRFRFDEPIELVLELATTREGKGSAGVRWWLIDAGGELSRGSAATQRVTMRLSLVEVDDEGDVNESALIDGAAAGAQAPVPLDG
jgi:Trypsin-co-occurring domain 2